MLNADGFLRVLGEEGKPWNYRVAAEMTHLWWQNFSLPHQPEAHRPGGMSSFSAALHGTWSYYSPNCSTPTFDRGAYMNESPTGPTATVRKSLGPGSPGCLCRGQRWESLMNARRAVPRAPRGNHQNQMRIHRMGSTERVMEPM